MKSSEQMEHALLEYSKKGVIVPRTENNFHLKVSYKGAGNLISEKWNVKIYRSGSVVTTDTKLLIDIINGKVKAPDQNLKLIQIDDAGFGFPLCGVMIGIYDGSKIWTDTVNVKLFQGGAYNSRLYIGDYSNKGLDILKKIGASPKTHRIEICSGFINVRLKNLLRDMKYDVRITEIKGVLQDQLENLFKAHVKDLTGTDLAYDPKEINDKKQIANKYYYVVNWGKKHAPNLLKTGWKALQ